jgi:hypothetical protein
MQKNKIVFIVLVLFVFQIAHSQNPTANEFEKQLESNSKLILHKDYL